MIKISKDYSDIPETLESKATQEHRLKAIEEGKYLESGRYKMEDIKEKLKDIYHHKCAYCEKSIMDSFQHIEHFRPKSIYYWLTFSWDNLLLCCDRCNIFKNKEFQTKESQVSFCDEDLKNIHGLHIKYDEIEKPFMINPEVEDVCSLLDFDMSGNVKSQDDRVQYTITTCHIDRKEANECRKKILDSLKKKINSRILEGKKGEIVSLIKDFKNDSEGENNDYLCFRRWVVNNIGTILPYY